MALKGVGSAISTVSAITLFTLILAAIALISIPLGMFVGEENEGVYTQTSKQFV
jgi:hypothetical protein